MAIYDDMGKSLTDEFELFLMALSGRYAQLRAPGVEVTPVAVNTLRRDMDGLANVFLNSLYGHMKTYSEDLYPAASEELSAELVYMRRTAMATVRGFVQQAIKQVDHMTLNGTANVASVLRDGGHGAMGFLIQKSLSAISFKLVDSSQRRWNAAVLFKVVVRDWAYQSWIKAELESLRDSDVDLVDTGKDVIISLKGSPKHPTFEYARDVLNLFHVNATATLKPYVQA